MGSAFPSECGRAWLIRGSRCGDLRAFFSCTWSQGLSMRSTARGLGVAYGSVQEVLHRGRGGRAALPLPAAMDDDALAKVLYQTKQSGPPAAPAGAGPTDGRYRAAAEGVTRESHLPGLPIEDGQCLASVVDEHLFPGPVGLSEDDVLHLVPLTVSSPPEDEERPFERRHPLNRICAIGRRRRRRLIA
jgi:hypothetical protein